MYLAGIDLGTSSVKVSVVEATTGQTVASAQYPETEAAILSPRPGWAEQSPDLWWEHVQKAIRKVTAGNRFGPKKITAIGIAYQMHGLVLVDRDQQVLRNAIIWCDSRAVEMGNKAFQAIGEENCLQSLLNSPGNFTASKLAWVKQNEPDIYDRIHKAMLPGDFIAMKLTGESTTTPSALSEGIFWDFKKNKLSSEVMNHLGFDTSLVPTIKNVFESHGFLKADAASLLGLKPGIPVSYKAGDQLNNALSLNVMNPGEIAATAGTSGVIYSVSDSPGYDPLSRVNSFAHVNHTAEQPRIGTLLCINGTGILNNWVRRTTGGLLNYNEMNQAASHVPAGADGLTILPFGNGAERMFSNRSIGAHMEGIDFNIHKPAHIYRAAQEGIAFAFRHGLDIMRENGLQPKVIRAGNANLFLSPVFLESFVNAIGVPVELYDCDGSVGAALGAGIGAGVFTEKEAFRNMKKIKTGTPTHTAAYNALYANWLKQLNKHLEP